jgi:uncharacterized protein DUF4245
VSQEQPARYRRSTGGLVAAMVVLVAVVLVGTALHSLVSGEPATPTSPVDYRSEVPAARKAADFALLAPPRLPAGWRATTVGYRDDPRPHWHLGVLTDQNRYVGLEQGDLPVRSVVHQYVDASATKGRAVQVDGSSWATYTDAGGDLGLVRRSGRTTTLVVGHEVPRAALVSYVASLR